METSASSSGWHLNPWPPNQKSDALPLHYRCFTVYTGYESQNELHSGLRYLCTGASMVQRQSTWHLFCSALLRFHFPTYIVYWPDGATDNPLHISERSFQSAAASTWNALPRSVRFSTSVFQLSSRLKTELLARSYQQSYWICLCVTVTQNFCSVILKSLDLCHVNYISNTN